LNNKTTNDSGGFAEIWSSSLKESVGMNELLSNKLDEITTEFIFPDHRLGDSLETVARLIATRETRGVDTDTFYVEMGGYDTHDDVEEKLNDLFEEVNSGLEAFAQEMKNMNIWNNVTMIQTSDFARTLEPNGGDGTDHAWGGNYIMMGGSVKGKQVLGTYPDNLSDDGPLTLSRGRLIPSTPWDTVFSGLASWLGVLDNEMLSVCPNLNNFNSSFLIDAEDMFDEVVTPTTPFPTPLSTKTSEPTAFSSLNPSASPSPDIYFGFDNNVLACDGDDVTVLWEGYHNIMETNGSSCDSGDISEVEGYLESGSRRTYSNNELTASPGERRYFKCSAHCGASSNRFEVYCPAEPTNIPSLKPSLTASNDPSSSASVSPSVSRSSVPSVEQSLNPSNTASLLPSFEASGAPSLMLSELPSSTQSSVPSSGVTTPCYDALLPVDYLGNALSCEDILSFGACDIAVAQSHCPNTCNACPTYKCVDSLAPFSANQNSYTCSDLEGLSETQVEEYCALPQLHTTCRGLCQICDV